MENMKDTTKPIYHIVIWKEIPDKELKRIMYVKGTSLSPNSKQVQTIIEKSMRIMKIQLDNLQPVHWESLTRRILSEHNKNKTKKFCPHNKDFIF